MTTAIYALSGDPITFGHIDIIQRASRLFDKLIVALGVNPSKKYLLTPEERLDVAHASLLMIPNVEVMFFEGLLVDFAYEQNAEVIIRGIRNTVDFNYEQGIEQINTTQMPIETLLMFSKMAHISSSTVKGLQQENGLIQEYVPLPVKKLMELKISDQVLFGITGVMGSGKSYVAGQLEELSRSLNSEDPSHPLVHNIDLDKLAHVIYTSDKPAYQLIRKKIEDHFGTLNRKEIGLIAFNDENNQEHINFLNKLFHEPVMVLLRKELRGKKGIVLINSAILIESDLLDLCNNHVILIDAEKEFRQQRLQEFRNIDPVHAENRIKYVKSHASKLTALKKSIEKNHFGQILKFDNTHSNSEDIFELYSKLSAHYKKSPT